MEISYVVADPAGNTTGLVLTRLPRALYRDAARELMETTPGHLEQVGFLEEAADCDGMLQMMGGEFCGNAARSAALYLAGSVPALARRSRIRIRVSGVAGILPVEVDRAAGEASIRMPRILAMETFDTISFGPVPVVHMEGISHALILDQPDRDNARRLLAELAEQIDDEAIGVMFYEADRQFMTPLVWVKATDTSIWESSCGSGSVSLAAWLRRDDPWPWTMAFHEPGGLLKVAGLAADELCLSGPVTFMGPFQARLAMDPPLPDADPVSSMSQASPSSFTSRRKTP